MAILSRARKVLVGNMGFHSRIKCLLGGACTAWRDGKEVETIGNQMMRHSHYPFQCFFCLLSFSLGPRTSRYGTTGENANIPSKLEELNKTCAGWRRFLEAPPLCWCLGWLLRFFLVWMVGWFGLVQLLGDLTWQVLKNPGQWSRWYSQYSLGSCCAANVRWWFQHVLQVQHQQLDLRGELNGHRYEPKSLLFIYGHIFF